MSIKQFKSDSQRLGFLIPSLGLCLRCYGLGLMVAWLLDAIICAIEGV